MWNPFKKKSTGDDDVKSPKMGMMQAMAMKKMAKMSPQERQKMMQEAMKPGNRDKIMGVMSAMKASGQVTDEQIAQAKKMLGM
ncbi:MAG: hypothetical protein UT50_C0006G0020 [Candidatus Moranbacteria bacterium GW2011_GWA2_39_41]|nr:MAG: hypothetical protein UT50_C0006G0020 [Candidatus Moranbacteria bacterium GW2011_GWA2_39_41]